MAIDTILKLTACTFIQELMLRDVKFVMTPLYEGFQWTFPDTVLSDGDVALHVGTYGCRDGYLESYQMPWDDGDVSVLKPDEMAQKIADAIKGAS